MSDFLNALSATITIGSLYALIALGYTMVYGILKLINFAHSDVVVLGAWSSLAIGAFVLPRMGIDANAPPWWAGVAVLVLSMVICGVVGLLIERLAYKPLRRAPRLNALITAMGVSLFLQNAGQFQWTVISPESVVATGSVKTLQSDNKTLVFDVPVRLSADKAYAIRVSPPVATTSDTDDAPAPVDRTIAAAPGDYAAGQPVVMNQPIGRTLVADATAEHPATFRIFTATTALRLPFGTQPGGTRPLMPVVTDAGGPNQNVLYRHLFRSTIHDKAGAAKIVDEPFQITLVDVVIVTCALALMAGLEILVFHTRLGTAMRAVSYNTDFAALMGIPIDRVISFTFVLGAMLAAAAGFLYGQRYGQINPTASYTWTLLGLKAFVAAVVGGIGNVRGAVVGAFLIAFIEQFGAQYAKYVWPGASAYTVVAVFALLILVLLVKPSGLFGRTVREKV